MDLMSSGVFSRLALTASLPFTGALILRLMNWFVPLLRMATKTISFPFAAWLLISCVGIVWAESKPPFELKDGDRVVFLGDALIEREQLYGDLETRLTSEFAQRKVI